MAVTSITASLFEDRKRNTATCYLKFNHIDDEIYLGFKFDHGDVSNWTNIAKTKRTRSMISGISATLSLQPFKMTLNLNIGQDHYLIPLTPTGQEPLTATGHWAQTQDFSDWLKEQLGDKK